jgi:hypothetical protein
MKPNESPSGCWNKASLGVNFDDLMGIKLLPSRQISDYEKSGLALIGAMTGLKIVELHPGVGRSGAT